MSENLSVVVGIRFSQGGKIYHFDATGLAQVRAGDSVVVETSRGWQLGQVALILEKSQVNEVSLKKVERIATARDLALKQSWQRKEADVIISARHRARELRLEGVKIINAEYSFDGSRLAILFSTESEDKIELKSLKGDMQRQYAPAQMEMKQIGPRDVAKLFGGMGACGLENRCCSRFLSEFSSISIKMAKEQGISLTPTEITGMCGRLRCCLIYEYELYVRARAELPKKNKRVITPLGEGRVVDVIPLREMIIVELPDAGYRTFPKSEVQPADELEALQRKAENPDCDNCPGPKK